MWNNNTGQFEGSGLEAQEMRLSLCWVSTVSARGFPCWFEGGGGCTGPPLLKVFHRGESSDVHGIQRLSRFCLWRRWNIFLCFTTIRLIDKADLNRLWDITCFRKKKKEKVATVRENTEIFTIRCYYCSIHLCKNSCRQRQSQWWMPSFVPSKSSLSWGRKLFSVWLMSQF